MISSTKGIVLSFIKYKESSIIVRIFTEQFGLRSYIVNSVRSARSKGKIALYQPLTILDLEVYENKTKNIQRISELKCHYPYKTIPFEISKMTIGIFISELLTKVLREAEDENQSLYSFLEASLIHFDTMSDSVGHFHLQFMLKLSLFLGFQPYNVQELLNQIELNTTRGVKYAFTSDDKKALNRLSTESYNSEIELSSVVKTTFLELIIRYYQLHEEQLGKLKSLHVLREVFHS
jgi:DNA repair protein RecO (recombination protein O)